MKIAIVGAEDSVQKALRVGRNCNKDIEFIPYFADICDHSDPILEECEAVADGVIFTGLGFMKVAKNFKILSKPYELISRDGSCLMKVFWEMNKANIKPERISIDVVTRSLVEDILEEFGMSFRKLYVFPYDEDLKETDLKERHKMLWENGDVDAVVTSYGWIFNELVREGVPVIRLGITAPIIRSSIDKLAYKIENQAIKKSQIAVQIVDIDITQDYNRYEYETLKKRNYIESMLLDYLPIIQGTVSLNRNNQYRIISTRGAIESDTVIQAFLKILKVTQTENIRLYTGVGFGHTAFDAEFNAKMALNKSKEAKESSYFIVDDKKRIIGPIGSQDMMKYESLTMSESLKTIAQVTGLSSTYISKIEHLSQNLDGGLIDAKKLAELLQISERSARRILKKLSDGGYAEIVSASQTNAVGRPTNIYRINIQK